MQSDLLSSKRVVLLGVGHTNAHVLRKWIMKPILDASLVCVSNFMTASYSGMLPAVLAGQVPPEDMEIDLVKLCSAAGAQLVSEPVVGLDAAGRQLEFEGRPPMQYDVLSVGIGSRPVLPPIDVSAAAQPRCLTIKPMQTFLERLSKAVGQACEQATERAAIEISVVGSGAAGVEIASCLLEFLKKYPQQKFKVRLLSRSSEVLEDAREGFRKKVSKALCEKGVEVVTGVAIEGCSEESVPDSQQSGRLLLRGQGMASAFMSDIVIWATGATAPPLLEHLGLPVDNRGFLKTDASLRCMPNRNVFAVGDSGSFDDQTPKAGVYAVRQGPILWQNIQHFFSERPLAKFQPQRDFLKLINLGDGSGVLGWRGLSMGGRLPWKLKDRIDAAFLDKHRPKPMVVDAEMQCAGCGCKLGADDLRAALARSGASKPAEDAVPISDDKSLVASVDFFTLPLRDAYTNGRLALLHASSDVVACGATPVKALASVVVPEGPAVRQSEWLGDFLSGARNELEALGGELVAGHTIVGPRAEAGFAVIGQQRAQAFLPKSQTMQGDVLVLTKPLGTGVALAAEARGVCDAATWAAALEAMLEPQHALVSHFSELGIHALTDVTGFGLAGHLLEMLDSSHVAATISQNQIPLLPGVQELVQSGVQSSLFPSNFEAYRGSIDWQSPLESSAKLLFDPQTCGGLLFSLPSANAPRLIELCAELKLTSAAIVGKIVGFPESKKRLRLEA